MTTKYKPWNDAKLLRRLYAEHGTIASIARLLQISETHLARKFNEFSIPYNSDTSKGYRTRSSDGYVLVKRIGRKGYDYEHRVIMENHLGRLLDDDEYVHHDNDIKDDNRIENLVVVSHKEHMQEHAGPARKTRMAIPTIRALRLQGYLVSEIAPIVDLCEPLIRRILNEFPIECGLCGRTDFGQLKALGVHLVRTHRKRY